jgi:hypothetical protein
LNRGYSKHFSFIFFYEKVEMDNLNVLKVLLLLMALPAQYYVSNYWSNNRIEQSLAIRDLISGIRSFRTNYLEVNSWLQWYLSLVVDKPLKYIKKKTKTNNKEDVEDEDIAVEVLLYRQTKVFHFGGNISR